jgi:hypothetical protein
LPWIRAGNYMKKQANRRLPGTRKLATKASLTQLIATAARKQKLLAKADLRAAKKSLKHAKEVARVARRQAREAARLATMRK